MSADIKQQIEALVKENSLSNSLSREALQSMLNEITRLEQDNEIYDQENKSLTLKVSSLRRDKQRLETANAELHEFQGGVELREKAVKQNEWSQMVDNLSRCHAEQRTEDHISILNLLLKNQTIVQRVQGKVPLALDGMAGIADNNGYVQQPGCSGMVGEGRVDTTTRTSIDEGGER